MSNWYTAHCEKCDVTECRCLTGEISESDRICEYHDTFMTVQTFEELTDIQMMIEITGCHLEDINAHSMTDLPGELWHSIKDTVSHLSQQEQMLIVRSMMKPFLNM